MRESSVSTFANKAESHFHTHRQTKSMYKKAFSLFRSHWDYILLMSLLSFGIELWAAGKPSRTLVPIFFLHGYVIYIFHFCILTDFKGSLLTKNANIGNPRMRFWLAFSLPLIALMITTFFIASLLATQLSEEAVAPGLSKFVALMCGIVILWFLLSLVGTMIPAAVLNKPIAFDVTLRRARKTFVPIFWRLLVGPGLYGAIATSAFTFMVVKDIAPNPPVGFSNVTLTNGAFSVLINFLSFFPSALTAAVLSMAYMRVEGRPNVNPTPLASH